MNRTVLRTVGMFLLVSSFSSGAQNEEALYRKALDELNRAETKQDRFYALGRAAKAAFNVNNREQAKYLAEELRRMMGEYAGDWNYGNAVQDVNIVLGRLSLSEGRTDAAMAYLLEAGKSPGSPQLKTFGPNMSLAADLLRSGEKDVVLKYFKQCAKFWNKKFSKLPQWTRDVQEGRIPDFGANLIY